MHVEHDFFVGLQDVGKGSLMNNKAYLEVLSNITNLHGISVGQSTNDRDVSHLGWVVINWRLEVLRRMPVCSIIRARTWAQVYNPLIANRDYLVFDNQGAVIAKATSAWMVINLQRKFPARLTPEIMDPYQHEPDQQNFPDNVFEKPEFLEVPILRTVTFTVNKSMIDCNNHVHNPAYLDLADEIMDEDTLFDHVEVCYKKEVKPGQTVLLEYGMRDGRHDVFIRNKDDRALHAWVELY